jgi:hypothetical protein
VSPGVSGIGYDAVRLEVADGNPELVQALARSNAGRRVGGRRSYPAPGESTVKNGSSMELRGVHYGQAPPVQEFTLQRKHVLKDEWATVPPDIAAQFGEREGYGHVAWSDVTRLRTGSRVLNRTWRFGDHHGTAPAGAIRTTKFGHLEVTTVGIEVVGTGHPPMVVVKTHVQAKPVKDPDVDVVVLVPGGRTPTGNASTSGRGYVDLDDLVRADLIDEPPEAWSAEAAEFSGFSDYSYADFGFDITPSSFHIPDDGVGSCFVDLRMYGPGRLPFAIQAIATDAAAFSAVDDKEFPTADDLQGVMVSDVMTLEVTEDFQVTVS